MTIYIGLIEVDPGVLPKLQSKHNVTYAQLQEALQWPAEVRAAFDDHPEHGPRWVAYATLDGEPFFAALLPLPAWEAAGADTWLVKTAFWVDG